MPVVACRGLGSRTSDRAIIRVFGDVRRIACWILKFFQAFSIGLYCPVPFALKLFSFKASSCLKTVVTAPVCGRTFAMNVMACKSYRKFQVHSDLNDKLNVFFGDTVYKCKVVFTIELQSYKVQHNMCKYISKCKIYPIVCIVLVVLLVVTSFHLYSSQYSGHGTSVIELLLWCQLW